MKSFDLIDGCSWYHVKVFLETEIEKDDWKIARADSPVHYLLVNEVFSPAIETYKDHLHLWRFHRQFRSWDEGMRMEPTQEPIHQFKFKFYAQESLILHLIDDGMEAKLKKLEKERLILKYEAEKSEDSGERIGSDRDLAWEYSMKLIWPFFIHGASLAWYNLVLNKVKDIVEGSFKDGDWLEEGLEKRLEIYDAVRGAIKQLWTTNANNVFLHHLNALFGYNKIWGAILP